LIDIEVGQRARITRGGDDAVPAASELGGDAAADAAVCSGD
jgi:hypothetical protein